MLKNSEKSPAREDASKKLSANLVRIRTKILKTVQDETLDDALSFLKERYNVEKDVDVRLATMAAQSWIIRQKFVRIGLDEPSSVKDHMGELLPKNKLAAMKPKAKSEEHCYSNGTRWSHRMAIGQNHKRNRSQRNAVF